MDTKTLRAGTKSDSPPQMHTLFLSSQDRAATSEVFPAGTEAQVVEHLPSKHKVWSSNPGLKKERSLS
jgi:hypothetical protein